MVDFLKANPFMTMDDYLWKYSIPMIKIMGMDNSHVNYLSEEQAKKHITHDLFRGATNIEELYTDLGTPVNFETINNKRHGRQRSTTDKKPQ